MSPAAWTLLAACLTCVAFRATHGYQYIGCYADGGDRDLPLMAERSGGMTVQRCSELCTTRKYPYFALQAGNECYCGNGFGKHGPKPTRECDHDCHGNRNQFCGGGWRNSLYTSDFDFGLRYIGCYVDYENRDLPELAERSNDMSVTKCYLECKRRKFAYFGVQNSNECWCGNSYGKHGTRSTEECNVRCTGERTELCGANARNSIYTTGLSPLYLPPSDPLQPHLRDQLAAQIRTQFVAFPKDVLCTTCLISAWSRRDVIVHSKVIPLRDLNSVLATYPEKVKQKVLPLQYGANAQTTFEDFSHQISGANAFRRTYLGIARRVNDNVELAMVDSNIEAQLATNFNIYHRQVCHKILWIFTKCDTHKVQEIRGYEPNEVALIDRAMQSEIFRLLGERLAQISV